MKPFLLALSIVVVASPPALAQSAAAQPGNCAIWLEEAAKTIKADPRFSGDLETDAVTAFNQFAAAQRKIVKDSLAKTYADSKALGWDKAKVDEMMAQNDMMMRQGFQTSTMEDSTLYTDHVIAINNCAEANITDIQMGQSREAFIETLTDVYKIVTLG